MYKLAKADSAARDFIFYEIRQKGFEVATSGYLSAKFSNFKFSNSKYMEEFKTDSDKFLRVGEQVAKGFGNRSLEEWRAELKARLSSENMVKKQ